MATHTQIIDLYGIPACGKTTLARYMASHPAEGLKVSTMEDCIMSALNDKWHLFLSVSLKIIWASISLKLSTPLDKKRRVIRFKGILLLGAFKNYTRKYTDYDIVFFDHGDIQYFVSLERGDNLHESEKYKKACMRYLNASHTTAYIYCHIDAGTALQRMNNRGREKGRMDTMSNQNLKLQELEKESKCFDFWTTVLNERKAALFELDMKEACPVISEKLIIKIKQL